MWYKISNESSISTPAILVYPDRIEENIERMIAIAGDVSRLRPHVKTHKLAEVVRLQVQHGITKFKCATLIEVEMVAENGGEDILLSYPLYGPGVHLFFDLKEKFPEVKFAVTVDSQKACQVLMREAEKRGQVSDVFVDIDNGMHRTGIEPQKAADIIEFILDSQELNLIGFHIYDGHIHDKDVEVRKAHVEKDFESINLLVTELKEKGIEIGELACGGTFSFPVHALHKERTLCPGTPLLWDAGYKQNIPELDFLHAAVLVGRVISKPKNFLCFDLGYKSMASEMMHPRLIFLNLKANEVLNHSEEHLVVSAEVDSHLVEGDIAYALPFHICPTIALHEQVYVVNNNRVNDIWQVIARKRIYQISK
ncbi:D-TA family PLP-dependent enzyme [Draconibacterium sp.]|nr:D-TA family PLP-dependent enzyme [Draconibacterium sp.]